MKKSTGKALSVVLLVFLILCFAYYIHEHISDFESLKFVRGWNLFWLFVLTLISVFIGSETGRELMKPFNVKIGLFEHFSLIASSGFYNLITPLKGGTLFRAHYLKKKYNFPYTHYISTFLGATFIAILVFSFLGLLSMLLLYLGNGISNSFLVWIFLICFFVMFFFCAFSPKIKEGNKLWKNRVIRVVNSWNFTRRNKKLMSVVIIRTLFMAVLSLIVTKLSYSSFSVEVSWIGCLFLVSVGSVLGSIMITPGNLGVFEAISVFSALALGITPVQTIAAVLLRRVIGAIILFVLGPVSSYVLYRKYFN
jgi:uncharacterized protein (TIRG00374 family)